MNKTLVAILIAWLATANASHAKESESKHAREHGQEKATTAAPHSEHDNHEEHDAHQPDTEHGHADHGDEDHDEHSAHDEHNSESEHGHEEHSEGAHGEHDNHGGHGGHEEAASASLDPAQMTLADIQVIPLTPRKVDYQLYAPGEILSNGYTSYRVSPRVPSVVLHRHVALGDHVEQGQPLVTLFSEAVAQAQANYRTAWPEWQRVQELGRKTVGEQRYIAAKTNLEAARATLLAYGLSTADLQPLVASQQSLALGDYTLRAQIDGAVLSDAFEQGQRIEAGEPLIALANEKQLWVEAHLPANLSLSLGEGTPAEVVTGDVRVKASVTQEAHTIDPITRTRTVRLLVNNPEHRLHPGQFAEVYFRFQTKRPVLAVPETALMRGADGDWTVFVEDQPGEFQPVEVELGRALGPLREISGVGPGARIVTQGAFFVASQIAKGGFDPHNH